MQRGIRHKMSRSLFLFGFFLLFLVGTVAAVGIYRAGNIAISTGTLVGQEAAQRSSQIFEDKERRLLTRYAMQEKEYIVERARRVQRRVMFLQKRMTDFLSGNQFYGTAPPVLPPVYGGDRDGKPHVWVLYEPGLSDAAKQEHRFQEEYLAAASLSELLLFCASDTHTISDVTVFIASEQGFIIEAGTKYPEWTFKDSREVPRSYAYKERPFYDMSEFGFTEPYPGARDGNMAIACSAPYYRNGQFAGVVGIGLSMVDFTNFIIRMQENDIDAALVVDKDDGKALVAATSGEGASSQLEEYWNDAVASEEFVKQLLDRIRKGESGSLDGTFRGKDAILCYVADEEGDVAVVTIREKEAMFAGITELQEAILELTERNLLQVRQTLIITFILLLVIFGVLIGALSPVSGHLSGRLIRPLHSLIQGARAFAGGNFASRVEVHTGDELEELASTFNDMGSRLQSYIADLERTTREKERIETELSVGRSIQLQSLPGAAALTKGRRDFSLAAMMTPAREVGGDFYDFYLLDDHRLVLTIGDVSGKGVPAALFMMQSRTALKDCMMMGQGMEEALHLADVQLSDANESMMFVTVFTGLIDLATGRLTYGSAGHNPPLIYRQATGRFERLAVPRACMLGIGADFPYGSMEAQLAQGDMLFLFTDGVTEAMDREGNIFSDARLLASLNEIGAGEPETLLAAVRERLSRFVDGAAQFDDITMLAFRYERGAAGQEGDEPDGSD